MKKLLAVMVGLAATSAFAASPGGSDMCGLGWQVTQKKTFAGTSTRATTNIVVPPTFGMTSGTIGCDRHGIVQKNPEAAAFVLANFENLRIEMAEGRGENLAAFSQVLGCQDADAFGELTQRNYRTIMNGAEENSLKMFENVLALAPCGA